MRLVKRSISEKDGDGKVVLIAEQSEDMWHAYNLITEGDRVQATTFRKVVKEGATGNVQSQRVRLTLTVEVDTVDFDPLECCIRLKGRNVEENPHVKLGAFHTIELEPNRKFALHKSCWDLIFLERLETACDPTQHADLGAIVMQQGLAHVCLISGHMTITRAKIEQSIPKKRSANSGHKKAVEKFYSNVLMALDRHINFDVVKCVLIASPGFVKDDFFKHMMSEASRRDLKVLSQNKGKFVLCHASSGYKHALKDVLADPGIQSRLADTKAAGEVKALENFFEMLNADSGRAFYGYNHVSAACQMGAIEQLLVTDDLFRSCDLKTRIKYVKLVEDCREAGAGVKIFSSLHVSGEQLSQLTGVAAILRFPMPEIEDMEFEDGSDDDGDGA